MILALAYSFHLIRCFGDLGFLSFSAFMLSFHNFHWRHGIQRMGNMEGFHFPKKMHFLGKLKKERKISKSNKFPSFSTLFFFLNLFMKVCSNFIFNF